MASTFPTSVPFPTTTADFVDIAHGRGAFDVTVNRDVRGYVVEVRGLAADKRAKLEADLRSYRHLEGLAITVIEKDTNR